MLEIRKTAVSFDESDHILHSQRGRLKSHLDATNTVEGFIQRNK